MNSHSATRSRDILIVAGCSAASMAILTMPYLASAALAILALFMFYFRQALARTAIEAITLVPIWMLFSGTPTEASSSALIGQQIEAGDPTRRIAIAIFLLIGLAFLIHKPCELRHVNVIIWITSYSVLAAASLLWSQDVELTLRRLAVVVAVNVFSVGVACVHYGRRSDGHVCLARAICWTSVLASFLIVVLAIYRGEFHPFDLAWRLGSTGHENQISQVAAVGLLAALATKDRRDIWPSRALIAFVIAMTALSVLLTKSRTTWLGLIAAFFVAEIYRRRTRGKRLAALLAAGILVAILTNTFAFQQLWARGESGGELNSASGRTELWQKVWPQVSKNLWLGYGVGAFWSPRTINLLAGQWAATSAHNGYLDIVAELGVVGLAVNLVLIFVSSRNAWRLLVFPEYREIGLFLLALNSMVLVINTSESFLHDIEYYPMIVFLVCSIFVSHRLSASYAAGVEPGDGLVAEAQ
jgi:exopolysaccharide production protein ExoQ